MPDAPTYSPQPDEDAQDVSIIESIRRGESSAWSAFIARHQDRIFSICVRMMHDRETATDLAQDVFVKLIQGINTFDGRAKLTTWITRVAMNVCLSKLRSEKLRRHASLEALSERRSGDDGGDGSGGGIELEQEREPEQGLSVEAHEDRERVLAALRDLDPEQRAILILCDCQGHSYEQIAEVFGVAVGTVKSRLFRARAALRDLVEKLPVAKIQPLPPRKAYGAGDRK
ncbi:MAG: RNA polymerase sigma factor [Planctomycetes bacterium]|nr:RNA polymerase sigma factor [Planctomycetota bacterium]